MSIFMPRASEQLHNIAAPGIALLRSSNASALLKAAMLLFRPLLRALSGTGEPAIQRPDFQSIEASLASELSNGHDPSLDAHLIHAERLASMAAGREHAERSRLRTAAQRYLDRTSSALIETVGDAVSRNLQEGRALVTSILQELQQDISRFSSQEARGDAVSQLTQSTSRIRQFIGMPGELCDDLLERAPAALAAALAPRSTRAERALARAALLEALPEVTERITSQLGLLEAKGSSFISKCDKVEHELRSRLAQAEALERQGTGGFERVLSGVSSGQLLSDLKTKWGVDDKNLPAAAGERFLQRLREHLKAERVQTVELLAQADDAAVLEHLLGSLSEGSDEQDIYAALAAADIAEQADFLWNAATPTALPSALADPQLRVHTAQVNLLFLPTTTKNERVRAELVAAVTELCNGGLTVVPAAPGESAIVLTRAVLGFPAVCDPQNAVLLNAWGKAIESDHQPGLAGEDHDPEALDIWRRLNNRS